MDCTRNVIDIPVDEVKEESYRGPVHVHFFVYHKEEYYR